VVVLGYFLGGWDTPNPLKNKKFPRHFQVIKDVIIPLGAKPLEARCEAASIFLK